MDIPMVKAVADEGLGNSAYPVDLGDGRTLTVDASRDWAKASGQSPKEGR